MRRAVVFCQLPSGETIRPLAARNMRPRPRTRPSQETRSKRCSQCAKHQFSWKKKHRAGHKSSPSRLQLLLVPRMARWAQDADQHSGVDANNFRHFLGAYKPGPPFSPELDSHSGGCKFVGETEAWDDAKRGEPCSFPSRSTQCQAPPSRLPGRIDCEKLPLTFTEKLLPVKDPLSHCERLFCISLSLSFSPSLCVPLSLSLSLSLSASSMRSLNISGLT